MLGYGELAFCAWIGRAAPNMAINITLPRPIDLHAVRCIDSSLFDVIHSRTRSWR
jgi:hypothetical protein